MFAPPHYDAGVVRKNAILWRGHHWGKKERCSCFLRDEIVVAEVTLPSQRPISGRAMATLWLVKEGTGTGTGTGTGRAARVLDMAFSVSGGWGRT